MKYRIQQVATAQGSLNRSQYDDNCSGHKSNDPPTPTNVLIAEEGLTTNTKDKWDFDIVLSTSGSLKLPLFSEQAQDRSISSGEVQAHSRWEEGALNNIYIQSCLRNHFPLVLVLLGPCISLKYL